MKNLSKLMPDWESLDPDSLKRYRMIGLLIMAIGIAIIVSFVPTIKIWFKILGAAVFGYGITMFRLAGQYLDR